MFSYLLIDECCQKVDVFWLSDSSNVDRAMREFLVEYVAVWMWKEYL